MSAECWPYIGQCGQHLSSVIPLFLANTRDDLGVLILTVPWIYQDSSAATPVLESDLQSRGSWLRGQHDPDTDPDKHQDVPQCCFNAGPASKTLAQHWNSIEWIPRVCWDTMAKCWANIPDFVPTLVRVCNFYCWLYCAWCHISSEAGTAEHFCNAGKAKRQWQLTWKVISSFFLDS